MSGTGKTASTEQIFVSILVFPPPVAGPFALPQGIQVVFPPLRAEGDTRSFLQSIFYCTDCAGKLQEPSTALFSFFQRAGKGCRPSTQKAPIKYTICIILILLYKTLRFVFLSPTKKAPVFHILQRDVENLAASPCQKNGRSPCFSRSLLQLDFPVQGQLRRLVLRLFRRFLRGARALAPLSGAVLSPVSPPAAAAAAVVGGPAALHRVL